MVLKSFGITNSSTKKEDTKPQVIYNHDAKILEIDVKVYDEITNLSTFQKVSPIQQVFILDEG